MNNSEDKKKGINSPEELAELEGKEGELKDESAVAVTGGIFEGSHTPEESSYMVHQTIRV